MKGKANNSAAMKSANRRLILKRIFREPVSRAELARATGLTRAAISVIVDELISDGLIMEQGVGSAGLGRKPVLLDIRSEARYFIGVDLARSHYTAGIVNLKGQVVRSKVIPAAVNDDPSEIIALISTEVNRMLKELRMDVSSVAALGVSTPGPVDIRSGEILNPPNFDRWHGFNAVEGFRQFFPVPVAVDNNAAALALTEKNCGAGRNLNSFLLLVVEWGVGAGIIVNDKVYRGMGGFGSEIGHTTIDIHGERCNCGNYGCVELYASIPAVLRKARMKIADLKSWREIVDRAEAGDPFCTRLVDDEARYLSAAIVNAMNLLELEGVILGGHIHEKPEMLINFIHRHTDGKLITRDMRPFRLLPSGLSNEDKAVSAAMIVIEQFCNGEQEVPHPAVQA